MLFFDRGSGGVVGRVMVLYNNQKIKSTFSGTYILNTISLKVDFTSKYLKIDPDPKDIGALGAKSGFKKSIFLEKPDSRSILFKT